jgi:uncharacterized glyoxalase superfamily protein PhnB
MTTPAKNCKSTVIPGLRYRNALAMIEWLVKTFGFEKQAVYANQNGVVMHAQLSFGNGMVMVGSVNNGTPSSTLLKQPDEIGGAETQTPYLVVSDIDGVYARAKAAGAKMLMDLEEKDYGGKSFTCSDPEGHVWHVGTFDPWESTPA